MQSLKGDIKSDAEWSSRSTEQIQTLNLKVISYSRVSGEEEYSPVIMEYLFHVWGRDGEYWNYEDERVAFCSSNFKSSSVL